MIYKTKPTDFTPRFEVVGCFCENNGRFLLLQRLSDKRQGDRWGLPGGKINKDDEESIAAMQREVQEETGVLLPLDKFSPINALYVKHEEYQFIYHMFSAKFENENNITINSQEHKAYKWVTPEESLKMKYVEDLNYCVQVYYQLSP